jgi:hypothetical protein
LADVLIARPTLDPPVLASHRVVIHERFAVSPRVVVYFARLESLVDRRPGRLPRRLRVEPEAHEQIGRGGAVGRVRVSP